MVAHDAHFISGGGDGAVRLWSYMQLKRQTAEQRMRGGGGGASGDSGGGGDSGGDGGGGGGSRSGGARGDGGGGGDDGGGGEGSGARGSGAVIGGSSRVCGTSCLDLGLWALGSAITLAVSWQEFDLLVSLLHPLLFSSLSSSPASPLHLSSSPASSSSPPPPPKRPVLESLGGQRHPDTVTVLARDDLYGYSGSRDGLVQVHIATYLCT